MTLKAWQRWDLTSSRWNSIQVRYKILWTCINPPQGETGTWDLLVGRFWIEGLRYAKAKYWSCTLATTDFGLFRDLLCKVLWDKAHEISHSTYKAIGSSQRSTLVNVKLVILFKTGILISYEQVSTVSSVFSLPWERLSDSLLPHVVTSTAHAHFADSFVSLTASASWVTVTAEDSLLCWHCCGATAATTTQVP